MFLSIFLRVDIKPVLVGQDSRSHLKKFFWPNLCVGPSSQLLGILAYACGLKLGPALTLGQNPILEMASIWFLFRNVPFPQSLRLPCEMQSLFLWGQSAELVVPTRGRDA